MRPLTGLLADSVTAPRAAWLALDVTCFAQLIAVATPMRSGGRLDAIVAAQPRMGPPGSRPTMLRQTSEPHTVSH